MSNFDIDERIKRLKQNIISVDGSLSREAATIALHVFRKHLNWSEEGKLPAGELMFVITMGLIESVGADDAEEYMIRVAKEACKIFREHIKPNMLSS